MQPVFTIVRYVVFGAVAVAAVLALGAMAVQRRMLNPFGRVARAIRDISDPFIKPIERRVLRSGGNPQSAPWWLIGAAIALGIVVISGAQWAVGLAQSLRFAAQGGGRSLIVTLLDLLLSLLSIALLVRVIGSWIGVGPYNKLMRPFFFMTEWFLAPLRRVLPPFGPLDLSPLVAWLIIGWVLRPLLLRF